MPELPEVETIKRELSNVIAGKKISAVEVRVPKLVKESVHDFKEKLIGAKVNEVRRRAKILIMDLSGGQSVLIHLKLTGQLVYRDKEKITAGGHPIKKGLEKLPNQFTHIIFTFSDNSHLYFNDLRKFGWMKLIETDKLEDFFVKEGFGPEPLEKDFTLEKFKEMLLRKRKARIKPLLMDQKFIAGIGNIYSDEVCFYAKIHPLRKVETLTGKEIEKLYQGIQEILKSAIEHRGSSVDMYVDIYGSEGAFVPLLKVYGREGEPCYNCQSKVKRIKIGGRSAHFCPKCQI